MRRLRAEEGVSTVEPARAGGRGQDPPGASTESGDPSTHGLGVDRLRHAPSPDPGSPQKCTAALVTRSVPLSADTPIGGFRPRGTISTVSVFVGRAPARKGKRCALPVSFSSPRVEWVRAAGGPVFAEHARVEAT